MADETLRRDARAVETPEEASALLVQRLRAGDIERSRVELAAGLGDEVARSVLPEPPPLLERLPALQRVRDLGPAAWVAAERACLAAWPDAQRSDLLRGALESLDAWLAEPSLERAQAARQRARPAPPTWPIGRAAAGLVAVLDDPLLGAKPLCSGLPRRRAELAQHVLCESFALGLIVPDADVPDAQRRGATPYAGRLREGLLLEDPGPNPFAPPHGSVSPVLSVLAGACDEPRLAERLREGPFPLRLVTGASRERLRAVVEGLAIRGADARLLPEESDRSGESESAWSVALVDPGTRKIACIKEVRGLTGLNLRESKNLVDDAPTSACWWLNEWDETRAALRVGFAPWLLR